MLGARAWGVLGGTALVLGALTAPAAAQPVNAAVTATTTIRLVVSGCDGCRIYPQRALSPGSSVRPARPDFWTGRTVLVRGGVAVLRVPTAFTPGMSFTISAPWEGNTDAVANIVLGSAGHPAGTWVSAAQATKVRRATACWAGTSSAAVRIPVSVTRVTIRGIGGPATMALAWANPTVPTVGGYSRTAHGALGNQEAYFC